MYKMALTTVRGARILRLFKCPLNFLPAPNINYREASSQCTANAKPSCGNSLKTGPCETSKKTEKVNLPQPAPVPVDEPEIKSKLNIICCGNPCPDALPRFDKLYYRRSDKLQRAYQQTWDECPEIFIKPKVVCCHNPIKPKLVKRSPKDRPQTACGQDICLQSKTKCPYLNMPDCKAGRKPPTCQRTTKPSNCQKRKPPYPAFSECKRTKSKARTNECSCLVVPSICEVWAYHNKQHMIKKPTQC